jgi:hypothetical protein
MRLWFMLQYDFFFILVFQQRYCFFDYCTSFITCQFNLFLTIFHDVKYSNRNQIIIKNNLPTQKYQTYAVYAVEGRGIAISCTSVIRINTVIWKSNFKELGDKEWGSRAIYLGHGWESIRLLYWTELFLGMRKLRPLEP